MENNEKKLVSVQPEMLSYVDRADLSGLSYDELVEMGKGISELKAYSQWLLGKLADKVSEKYGDLQKFAKDTGQIYEVLQMYASTYRKYTKEDPDFSPDKYFGSVPWGMLQLVGTKSDMPVTLLNELVDKGIHSTDSAYREIKTKETGKEVPSKPKVSFIWNDETSKWKIKLLPRDLDLIDWTDIRDQLVNYLNSLT